MNVTDSEVETHLQSSVHMPGSIARGVPMYINILTYDYIYIYIYIFSIYVHSIVFNIYNNSIHVLI